MVTFVIIQPSLSVFKEICKSRKNSFLKQKGSIKYKKTTLTSTVCATSQSNEMKKEAGVLQTAEDIRGCDSIYTKLKYLRKSVEDVNEMMIKPEQTTE